MTRRTKIVATIGPASDSPDRLRAVIEAGVDVVRLNLSHGPIEGHLDRLGAVRDAADSVGKHVGVLADLPGPKIRAGKFPEGGVTLEGGDTVRLRAGNDTSNADVVHVDYDTLIDDMAVDDRLIIGDGAISLRVTSVGDDEAEALIETGAHTQGRPGVHLASERFRPTTPTDEDLVLAEHVAAAGVEYVAVSFVRQGTDMAKVREVVGDRAKLVAKIETAAAASNLTEIMAASDAIMVARGDLGIDCPLEDVPFLQKEIIRSCVEYGIPVITATQMLESMIYAQEPTRAEVTDVANAIFDGTDALMLSGETAIGHDPVGTVSTMAAIAARAEAEAHYRSWALKLGRVQRDQWDSTRDRVTAALTHAASEAAVDLGVDAILCCTGTGRTAIAMARFRPSAQLIALSPMIKTVHQLTLSWGVTTLRTETYDTTDEIIHHAVERTAERGLIGSGDTIVVLAGSPLRSAGTAADVMRIVQLP